MAGIGVIYDVRQTTTCSYASPVAHARHALRLMPVARDRQHVHVAVLTIAPEPQHRREGQDFFGNRLTWIEIEAPHEMLTVKLAARVAVNPPPYPTSLAGGVAAPLATPAWEAVREQAFASGAIDPLSPAHFLFPSRMVPLDPEIRNYVSASFTPGRPILDAAIELMGRLRSDIVYQIGATTVTTMPPRAFALRRGVCQDFAHIMLSGLRGLGLPALYVSGYLRSTPPTDATRLQGAQAMHAWVMLWCGPQLSLSEMQGWGWIGLDPTNAMLAGEEHVTLAIGRDYTDVAPVAGVLLGSGGQRMAVAVNVTALP
ncbi:MAG TPA: transglutaminase family protein [Xanthobacteraceae bacterium]